jgi:hypothetical protein
MPASVSRTPLAAAPEQQRAHHLLQPADLLAQRRLRDIHALRRTREGASVGNGDK